MKEQFKNCNDKFDDGMLDLQNQIDSLFRNITADKEDIDDLKENVANLEVSITDIESEVDDVDQRVIENTQNIDSNVENIGDIQTNLNTLENKPRFVAQKRSGDYLPYGNITDFTEIVDVGDIFNPTTGRLSIKDKGYYVLHVSAYKSGPYSKIGEIGVHKNDHWVQSVYEGDVTNDLMLDGVFILYLQKGDEVKLYNGYDDSIWNKSYNPLTFTGYKI